MAGPCHTLEQQAEWPAIDERQHTMSNLSATQPRPNRLNKIVVTGIIATIAAIIGNVLVFYASAALQGEPLLAPDPRGAGQMQAVVIVAPILLTAIGSIGATLVFAIIKRFTRRPVLVFSIVALVVLALSYLPLLLPLGLPSATVIAFAIMHLVAAGIVVPVVITMGR